MEHQGLKSCETQGKDGRFKTDPAFYDVSKKSASCVCTEGKDGCVREYWLQPHKHLLVVQHLRDDVFLPRKAAAEVRSPVVFTCSKPPQGLLLELTPTNEQPPSPNPEDTEVGAKSTPLHREAPIQRRQNMPLNTPPFHALRRSANFPRAPSPPTTRDRNNKKKSIDHLPAWISNENLAKTPKRGRSRVTNFPQGDGKTSLEAAFGSALAPIHRYNQVRDMVLAMLEKLALLQGCTMKQCCTALHLTLPLD